MRNPNLDALTKWVEDAYPVKVSLTWTSSEALGYGAQEDIVLTIMPPKPAKGLTLTVEPCFALPVPKPWGLTRIHPNQDMTTLVLDHPNLEGVVWVEIHHKHQPEKDVGPSPSVHWLRLVQTSA